MLKDCLDKKGVLVALGGVAALAGRKFLSSKTARKMAVNTLAEGMKLKEEATATFESIKEDASDLKEEAKRQAQL